VSEELADVLYWLLLMCHDFHIDIVKAFKAKMVINKKKYPVKKSMGKHTKYTEL
jgi:dCTP diphosphatase